MTRRPDIDNLRSAATFLLLAFHSAKVFDVAPFYHLKDEPGSYGLDLFTAFLHQWHMPLFFVLAGWSMAATLRRRSAPEIRRERARRLLVPLVVWSLLVCPWIRWIELRHIDGEHDTFLEFLPRFFGPLFSWSHLWFLAYLFTFSLLYLPWFVKLNARVEGPRADARTLRTFVLVMIGIQVGLRWAWPGFQNLFWDWANFSYYSAFFVGGFFVGRFPSVAQLVDDQRVRMGRIGLVAAACMIPFWLDVIVVEDASDWAAYVVYFTLSALAGVGIVTGILGWARRHFAGDGRLHAWAKDSAFGAYILHQACVVAVALPVVRTPWPVAAKFPLTVVGATLLTVALYEALRRVEVFAPAFGRDRRVTPSPGTSAPPVARTPQ